MNCEYCGCGVQYDGIQLHFQNCSMVIGDKSKEWVHPSKLPDGPERDAWLEAEARYMPGDKPPPAMLGIAPMLPKLGAVAWLHRACTWMMK
jgi:hypothetical protein